MFSVVKKGTSHWSDICWSPLYLMEASLSPALYFWYAKSKRCFSKKLWNGIGTKWRSGTSWLLFTDIKPFILLKFLNWDLDSTGGPNAYSLMHLVMEYMTEVAMMHLPPINHCQPFLQRDMENEKYSNLNNGGKTNTPENFSIAFASIAKFVMKKVQRPSENSALEFQPHFPQYILLTFISGYWSSKSSKTHCNCVI